MTSLGPLQLLFAAAVLLFTTAFLRLLYILPTTNPTRPTPRPRGAPTRLLIVLGSGGHTAEMLALLKGLDTSLYKHRTYLISEGDAFSAQKAREYEATLAQRGTSMRRPASSHDNRSEPSYDVAVVPRARKIHQPLLTTPFSALHCLAACFRVLYSPLERPTHPQYPDLVISNGPGTAVCVVLACLLLRFFGAVGSSGKMRTVYVESWARVRGLSFSGKILVRCVDRFLVQWETLKGAAGRAEYLGVLV